MAMCQLGSGNFMCQLGSRNLKYVRKMHLSQFKKRFLAGCWQSSALGWGIKSVTSPNPLFEL